jgi:hypothetical protein
MSIYNQRPFLARAYAFHFSTPPAADLRSLSYLASSDPADVTAAVLVFAQGGDFSHFSRLIPLMKQFDEVKVWAECSMLFSYAAPSSALRALLRAFSDDIFERKDAVTQQWIAEILCNSGLLWCVPEVLRSFRANEQRDEYCSTPISLSYMLESERGEIADGPALKPPPEPWPEWLEYLPKVYDDDAYNSIVMARYEELSAGVEDPERTAVFEGEPLSLQEIAHNALRRIAAGQDIEEIAIARTILEANTGVDLSACYKETLLDRLGAAATIEVLLDEGVLTDFEPGTRYFFGHRIPD